MCIYTYICQLIIPPELAHFLPASITFSVTELQIASFQFLHIYQFIISPASVQSRISHRYKQIALYISPQTYISSPTSSTNFYPHSTGIFWCIPFSRESKGDGKSPSVHCSLFSPATPSPLSVSTDVSQKYSLPSDMWSKGCFDSVSRKLLSGSF